MEKINDIVAYASDSAVSTTSYVADKLDLYTNSYKLVEILCIRISSKIFSWNEFNTPRSCGYSDVTFVLNEISKFELPTIIKPLIRLEAKGYCIKKSQ